MASFPLSVNEKLIGEGRPLRGAGGVKRRPRPGLVPRSAFRGGGGGCGRHRLCGRGAAGVGRTAAPLSRRRESPALAGGRNPPRSRWVFIDRDGSRFKTARFNVPGMHYSKRHPSAEAACFH